jgi:hypothetical protein
MFLKGESVLRWFCLLEIPRTRVRNPGPQIYFLFFTELGLSSGAFVLLYPHTPQRTVNRHLNNEGQECKTGHVNARELVGEVGKQRLKEGEYGQCIFYTCMNMEY